MEWIRTYCLGLPHATEVMQWGECLVFKVAGKIFAILNLDQVSSNRLSFKCTQEEAAELVEQEGIIPAPHLARNHWVCFQDLEVVTRSELKRLIRQSYDMVFANLPKKTQTALTAASLR